MTGAVLADAGALAVHVAEWLTGTLDAQSGPVSVALSGGSTPKLLYRALAEVPFVDRMPWDRVHWFWGDERFVPVSDVRSNRRMAIEAMLHPGSVPPGNIHPIPTEGLDATQSAARYQDELQAFYGAAALDPSRPLFDIVLLGLGADGHLASLFPDSPALAERGAWTAAVTSPDGSSRITLTYPVLESCRHAAFLVAGAEKRDVLAQVRAGANLPATQYRPQGVLHWFVDQGAD